MIEGAVVAAVAKGGVITFDCGASPVTIMMQATAKVHNASSEVVLDGTPPASSTTAVVAVRSSTAAASSR